MIINKNYWVFGVWGTALGDIGGIDGDPYSLHIS